MAAVRTARSRPVVSEKEPENGGVFRYQVRQNSARLDRIEVWQASVNEDRVRFKDSFDRVHRDLEAVSDELRAFRRALLTGTIGFVSGILILTISILLATGKLG